MKALDIGAGYLGTFGGEIRFWPIRCSATGLRTQIPNLAAIYTDLIAKLSGIRFGGRPTRFISGLFRLRIRIYKASDLESLPNLSPQCN